VRRRPRHARPARLCAALSAPALLLGEPSVAPQVLVEHDVRDTGLDHELSQQSVALAAHEPEERRRA